MPFDWKSYVELAMQPRRAGCQCNEPRGCASVRPEQGLLRCVLLRANYARDWLKFDPRNNTDDHGRLRAHLKSKRRHGDANRLDRLRRWRNECDYLDELTFDLQTTVPLAFKDAEMLFASLVQPKPKAQ